MNWYKNDLDLKIIDPVYNDAVIFKNDFNLKPDWVEHSVENSEFHIFRKQKSILVVVGESWTYGESLPDVATGDKKYSLDSQLRHCFGPKLALSLGTDYYQYAVPGNCNFYMISSIEKIIQHLKITFSYEKIHLCIQLTEPSREYAIIEKLENTFAQKIYNMSKIKSFDDWLVRYDEIFLDKLSTIAKDNVEITVWKNFCPFQNKKVYSNLKLIQETWIQLSSKLYGEKLGNQRFQSVGWFNDFYDRYKDVLKFDLSGINQELDNIEASNNFIKGNYLHNNHPNQIAHSLWAYKLYNEYTK